MSQELFERVDRKYDQTNIGYGIYSYGSKC